jgi:hypothetical protein
MPITKDNKVHKCCARTLSVNSTYLKKKFQATKSSNPIGLGIFLKKNQAYTLPYYAEHWEKKILF